jgi:Fe-S-cluster-containing hydrogenase component 2
VDVCPTQALEIVEVEKLGEAFAEKRRKAASLAVAAAGAGGAVVLDLAE